MIGATDGGTTEQTWGAQGGGTSRLLRQIGCTSPLTHLQTHSAEAVPLQTAAHINAETSFIKPPSEIGETSISESAWQEMLPRP